MKQKELESMEKERREKQMRNSMTKNTYSVINDQIKE